MKRRGIVLGIACAVAALMIILTQVGLLSLEFLGGISLAKTIWGVILLVVAILAFSGRLILEGIGAITAIVCIFREEIFVKLLGLKAPSIGIIIVVGVLIWLAFHFLLPKKPRKPLPNHGSNANCGSYSEYVPRDDSEQKVVPETMEGDHLYIRNRFNGTVKYINSTNLESVDVDSEFGGTEIYFNNAQVPSGVVTLNIHAKCGGMKIYIPASWEVEEHINNQFGGVEYKGMAQLPSDVKMILNADVSFSGMEIVRV